MQRTIERWQIEHDPDATRQCYAQLRAGSGCTCNQCRNFDAAVGRIFPATFVALADGLGIDLTKPAELCHYNREPSGLYLTNGWFHFVGSIFAGDDATAAEGARGTLPAEEIPIGFTFGLSSRLDLVPQVFIGLPLTQLNFMAHVPWVLPEPEPEP